MHTEAMLCCLHATAAATPAPAAAAEVAAAPCDPHADSSAAESGPVWPSWRRLSLALASRTG